ncbi:hypothetical protein T03_11780 [Trichinella britovi]|uniref:Uncharacterized protein n=1 Tax=Trichinella britovi TaxID=45882 RepID=A0A0V0YUV9_TRIBR|nr:hypothetical protein T03_11780 [Trichinella britovi]
MNSIEFNNMIVFSKTSNAQLAYDTIHRFYAHLNPY